MSFAFTATFDLSDQLTESDGPVSAYVTGWSTFSGDSQIFMQINMSLPVDRSFQILLSNSFDVHLRDFKEDRLYFLPEDSDGGPLEDIVSVVFLAPALAVGHSIDGIEPAEEGGYVWKGEDSRGSTTALYDQEYLLREFVVMDADRHELIRATFFGYNEQYSVAAPEKGELLPKDYWGSP